MPTLQPYVSAAGSVLLDQTVFQISFDIAAACRGSIYLAAFAVYGNVS